MARFVRDLRAGLERFKHNADAVKIALLITCLISTVSAYYVAVKADQRVVEFAASEAAVELGSDLEQSLSSYSALLKSLSYTATTLQGFDDKTFSAYVRNYNLQRDYEGLSGVGWSVKIPNSSTTSETSEMPSDAHSILFIEPMNERNRAAIGYDMFTDKVRRKAMLDAARTGEITATEPIKLVQEITEDAQSGILLYAPVYRRDTQPNDGALIGYVYAIIRVESMVKRVVPRLVRQSIQFAVYAAGDKDPIYQTQGFASPAAEQVISAPITFLNSRWALKVDERSAGSRRGIASLKYYTLAGGLLCTAVIYLLTTSAYERRAQAEKSLTLEREQNRIRSVLVKELNHRVKNSLATVLSLASLSRRHAADIDDYYEGFSARVSALAGAHDILTRSNWHAASMDEIIKAELGAHMSDNSKRIIAEGPNLELKPSAALTLGLAIHELATNAAKYGSLTTPSGCVYVNWTLVEDKIVDIQWTEKGGPIVSPPTTTGFGSLLLSKLTARELGGEVDIKYDPDGLTAHITMDWSKTKAGELPSDFQDI